MNQERTPGWARTERIPVCVAPDEKLLIEAAARDREMSVSNYMVQCALGQRIERRSPVAAAIGRRNQLLLGLAEKIESTKTLLIGAKTIDYLAFQAHQECTAKLLRRFSEIETAKSDHNATPDESS